jgi:hypothetical protein
VSVFSGCVLGFVLGFGEEGTAELALKISQNKITIVCYADTGKKNLLSAKATLVQLVVGLRACF